MGSLRPACCTRITAHTENLAPVCSGISRTAVVPSATMKRQRRIEEAIQGASGEEQQHKSKASAKQRAAQPEAADAAPGNKRRRSGRGKAAQPEEQAAPAEAAEAAPQNVKTDTGTAASGRKRKGKAAAPQQQEAEEKGGEQQAEAAASDKAAGAPAPASELPDNAVEQGRIFFLYKPTVGSAGGSVSGLKDVQRFYLLLQPQTPAGGSCRLIVVGKKKLPDTKRHERFFAFVEATASTPAELTSGMTEQQYSTKTRGQRTQPAARAAGEGQYMIAKGGSRGGAHLAYKLELPQQVGEAQKVLGIKEEGSFVISAKNPENKGRPGVPSAGPEPEYSEQQQEKFQGRAWIGVDDRSLLDVAGTELLLVGAKDDPVGTGELGPAGDVLQQASDEEAQELQAMDQEQQEQQLKQALSPKGAKGRGRAGGAGKRGKAGGAGGGDDSIPVAPAVTGQLK